jgi:RNA polymerase sigma-70 factor (ECF subfamily)
MGPAEIAAQEDDALVALVAAGDVGACRELAERHLDRIVAFAYRMVGSHADAEDVAQETFVRLWTYAADWRPGGPRLTTWLHRVALNLCRDHRRRHREHPLEAASEPQDPTPSASERLATREVEQHVRAALATLPERQRAAIALCHYQDLGNVEAAATMEISVEALESLLARGRRTLRARLAAIAPELLGHP